MNWVWGSLRQKLLLGLIIITVIPIGVTAAVNIVGTSQLLQEEVENNQLETTRIVTGQVNQFIGEIETDLQSIGQVALELDLSNDPLNKYLQTTLDADNTATLYDSLWLMDTDGQELAKVSHTGAIATDALTNRHEEEVFFRPQRGETYFSNVRLTQGVPQISISIPIYHDDVFAGVIAAIIDLQEPWSIIRDLTLGEGGYALLADRRGNLIVHRDETLLNQRLNLATTPAISSAVNKPNHIQLFRYTSPLVGKEVLGTATLITGPNWVLAIERPADEAFRAESQARWNALVSVGGALVLAIGISLFIARQITRPVSELRNAAQKFGAGDLSVRTIPTTDDEIGDLANTFNIMADRLNARIQEINEKNTALQLATEKEREASRLKDEFVAIMSHELRTPLNAIIGFTGILLMDNTLDQKHRHQLERIEANSERLLNLINDILDISRIQAGRLELISSPINIRHFINRITAQISVLAEKKDVVFEQMIASSVPDVVNMDEDALMKIINNLLSNAIKFTHTGKVELIIEALNHQLQIKVKDTGIGIAPHQLDIIFEEFRQVDGSSKRAYGGTGLGLAITRRLCEAMGGSIRATSVLNQGSCFIARLPLEPLQPEEARNKTLSGGTE